MRPAPVRKIHTVLSLLFSPLLAFFIVTGCWQMLVPEDIRDGDGWVAGWMDKLATVHKDAYFPKAGVADPSTVVFKILTGCMAAALLATILFGLYLAWRGAPKKSGPSRCYCWGWCCRF